VLEERSDLSIFQSCGREDVCGFGAYTPCKEWVSLDSQDTGNGTPEGHSYMMDLVLQAQVTRLDNHCDGEASQKGNYSGSRGQTFQLA
jgi:hypothetical protein